MACKLFQISAPVLLFACLASTILAQTSAPQPSTPSAGNQETPEVPFVLREYSRMVNLDVVVQDSKKNHIRGLKAGDFQIFEESTGKRGKREQKIAEVREIQTETMAAPAEPPANTAPGVYSNAIAVQKDPVPATVLVMDGLNTEVKYQAQVHKQMLRMLKQLPSNVPVAVFLMGDRLRLLQSLTTDPALVREALAKAESPTGQGLGHVDPKDDASAPGNQMYGFSGSAAGGDVQKMISFVQNFDQVVYAANLTERFNRTYIAFLSIARSLAGYPGRKNLLWLSTSFPLTLNTFEDTSNRFIDHASFDYWGQMKVLMNALSDAKVAVYPIDIGGVRTLETFSAGTRPADSYAGDTTSVDGRRVAASQAREMDTQNREQDAMYAIAKDTGGDVCMGENDLSKCIQKAVHESSDFYEISYYPDSPNWNGEYRKVTLKVKARGAHASYRQGYYATPEGGSDQASQSAEMGKDCGDLLNATEVAFSAHSVPADKPGQLKFDLSIDPSELTFVQTAAGEQKVDLQVGVCTFNKEGWSQKLLSYPIGLKLNRKAYDALIGGARLQDTIFVPAPKPAAVRLIVKDVPSGKLGSVYIPTAETREAASGGPGS